jgi:FlaA1/EpsC-like NDP-sugar epimerase
MRRDIGSGYVPVAVFDDDPRTQGLSLGSVPVVGGIDDIPEAARRLPFHQLVLAVPSADGALVRRVAAMAEAADVALKVLPGLPDLLGDDLSVRDVRDLRIEDLLGRTQVDIDMDEVGHFLRGRTVLVTGAGGSIGSEIVRQVSTFDPGLLVMFDHDETHLHDAATSAPESPELVLGDVRDAAHLEEVISLYQPEVVFHAAAHKHVPLLERHASQAVTTNVAGTDNLVRSAARHGVEHLVFISSDKAVRPASVMGATKWLGEQLVLNGRPDGASWCAVRFGNVLGSRGSVIPTFVRQIEAGGPVTVTDARMTRYFMSVAEAVRLVLQASAYAAGGEVFMLEMGEPVNILQLAERMIRLSGRDVGTDVAIKVVGQRPGEKLTEELRAPHEDIQPTAHPSIVRLHPTLLPAELITRSTERLVELAWQRRDSDISRALVSLAGGDGPRAEASPVLDLREEPAAPARQVVP